MLFDERAEVLDSNHGVEVTRFAPGTPIFVITLLFLLCPAPHAIAKIRLIPKPRQGEFEQVRVILEARGHLKLNADGSRVTRLPLSIKGDLLYDERRLKDAPTKLRAVRQYRQAEAAIRIGKNELEPRLADEHRLLVVQQTGNNVVFHSPFGPLSRDELDLVKVQANSLLLDQLLPGKEVELEAEWSAPEKVLGSIFLLDDVSNSEVKCVLRQVEGELAIIDMAGSLSGAVGGVATDIDVKAKLNVDLEKGRVNWLAMTIKEDRSIGHAEPGLEVTARLRVAVRNVEDVTELSDEALESLALNANSASQVLRFDSEKGRFQAIHDPRWLLMVDRRDVSIFRFVDRGDLVAQCNISSLTDLAAGKKLKLSEFQQDIQSTLDKNFGQFVEAAEFQSEAGLNVLRVAVSGTASELPIHWVYYHLSNAAGRCASLVFTFEAKLAERFGGADASFVDGFRLRADQPSSAAASGADRR